MVKAYTGDTVHKMFPLGFFGRDQTNTGKLTVALPGMKPVYRLMMDDEGED